MGENSNSLAKKPTAAQRKVLEAMRDGKALERRSPLRINKPRYWTLDSRKIAGASPDACHRAGWIDAVYVDQPFGARWGVLYTLTDLGRRAITGDDA